jgi:DegV family protein with EDD domain
MKIAYVTDSGTGRSINELAADGILSVPLQIIDGNNTYQDLETIDRNKCIELVEQQHVLKTSQPSPGLIEECFKSLKDQGVDLIIAVPICNGLSGTASTMTAIAQSLDMKIICIDTYVTSEVQNYLIHRIKELYDEGKSDMEVKLITDEVINSCNTLIVPQNLDALVRGGRLTPMAAGFAKLLKIVPILRINKSTGGRIDSYANVRTYRKAAAKVLDIIGQDHVDGSYRFYIAHSGCIDMAMDFYHKVENTYPEIRPEVIELISAVAVHTGRNCIAIQYFKTL